MVHVAARDLTREETLAYLQEHDARELLRFVTIGSVDDGKSTLIGRLLFETGGVFDDQLEAVTRVDADGNEIIDFANITDGLLAEREQGITIDVAYRYFSTKARNFIIADTPGHVQYTRNMATGASTAQAAIILVDARNGVLEQTRRHAYIAHLLGIPHLIVAINKMDLVDYHEPVFRHIALELGALADQLSFDAVHPLPVSALLGDNVVQRSDKTPWYEGKTLLELLETLPLPSHAEDPDVMLPVQLVLRPNLDFRGYAGTLSAGRVRPGDEVEVLPSRKTSRVAEVYVAGEQADEGFAPQAVTVTLEDEIDISRGDALVSPGSHFVVTHQVDAHLVWMSETPLKLRQQYLVKHGASTVGAWITDIEHRVELDTLQGVPADGLGLNEIGVVRLRTARPLVATPYRDNRDAGAFIVIDRLTNATIAAGMIDRCIDERPRERAAVDAALTARERARRFAQKPAVLWLTGRPGGGKIVLARAIERKLFEAGHFAWVTDPSRLAWLDRDASGDALDQVADFIEGLVDTGLIIICPLTAADEADRQRMRARLSKVGAFLEVHFDVSEAAARNRLATLGRDPDAASIDYTPPTAPDMTIAADDLDLETESESLLGAMRAGGIIG